MDAGGIGHVLVDQVVDAPGRGQRIEAERLGHPPQGRLGDASIQAHLAAQEEARVEVAGVRDRRLLAAAAVAGRARLGPGALRADRQQAQLVDSGQAPTAGPDLDQLNRRRSDRQPGAFLEALLAAGFEREGGRREAVIDQARLGRRAAHVEGQHVALAGLSAEDRRHQRPGRRAALQ